ncbi:hypothetical protein COOONC_11164 [Cooperia oncophora]
MEVFQNQAWCRAACFSSFWAHYHAVEKWRADHARMASVSCRIANEKKEKKKHPRKNTASQSAGHNSSSYRVRSKKSSNKEKSKEQRHVSSVAYKETVSMEIDEMSDEMVAFFKKTIEHRKTRDAERIEKEQRAAKERGESTAHLDQTRRGRVRFSPQRHVSMKKKQKRKTKEEDTYENNGHLISKQTSGHHSKKPKEYRRKARGMNLSRTAVREKRHITLPYHLIGGNVLKSCEFIARMTGGEISTKSRWGGDLHWIGTCCFFA